MYKLPYFQEPDPAIVLQFIRDHPFAFIGGCDAAGLPVATQVPVFVDEKDGKIRLSGHLMKQTDHHLAFLQNPNVLAVFTGPSCYVSASWYKEKKQASTWNYISVHAKGRLQFQDDQALLDILKRTTDHFEDDPHSGSNFDDLPRDYVDKLARAIVVFEIEVTALDNVFKLSQNHDQETFDNIIGKLSGKGESGKYIAGQMKQRRSRLFEKE